MNDPRTTDWRALLEHVAREAGSELARAGEYLLLGSSHPPVIAPYRGYGNDRRVLVHGRALRAEPLPPAMATDSVWRNLINTMKRVDVDPLAGARVLARVAGTEREIVADDEGFFREWIDLAAPLPLDQPWHPAELRLLSPTSASQPPVRATAQIRLPAGAPSFGVISDLDDTVIQSRITSFLQAVRTVMLGNARTRLPFPGVAAFYSALERGGDGMRRNPIFYVSSSPWNVYDIIAEFMEIQRIPTGPIHLRDWDVNLAALTSARLHVYKEPVIREILDLYPSLPFILIGDDSQQDPEIYRGILDRYPGRILAIYIRSVRADPSRSAAVQALANEVRVVGSSLVLADDTFAAASHAVEHGWITKDSLAAVHEEKRDDEGTTGVKADVPGTPEPPSAPTVVVE